MLGFLLGLLFAPPASELGKREVSGAPRAGFGMALTEFGTIPAGLGVCEPGQITLDGGDTAPEGWCILDGQAISRSENPRTFARYGTKYGAGDGTNTFNVPNCKHRTVRGLDSTDTSCDVLGETGGTSGISIAQMPAHDHGGGNHSHNVQVASAGAPRLGVLAVGSTFDNATVDTTSTSAGAGFTVVASQGSGSAHYPEYITLNYIMKLG